MELVSQLDESTAQAIHSEILEHAHLFGKSIRTQYEGSAHVEVYDIVLRAPFIGEDTTLEEAHNETVCIDYPEASHFPILMQALEAFAPRNKIGRVIVTCLQPSGIIYPHKDEGKVPDLFDRYHYVVQGGEGNTWMEGLSVHHHFTGELYKTDVSQQHCIVNMMEQERVHVVFDVEKDDADLPD